MPGDPAHVTGGDDHDARAGSDPPATPPPEDGFRLRTFLNGSVAFDIVVPIVAYQVLIHLFDLSRVPALVLSGAFPAVNVVRRYVRDRRVDPIGVIVVVSILVGAALSLLSGSEKLTLLRESFLTAAFGVAFLVSLLTAKPIMFLLVRSFMAQEDEQRLAEWDGLWREVPEFRRVMRQMTAMWGVALLAEFALKVVMIETLSTDVVQAISGPLILALTALLIVVSIRWGRRVRERGEAEGEAEVSTD
jgi:intracellular septation protein A